MPSSASLRYIETIEAPVRLPPERAVIEQYPSLQAFLTRDFATEQGLPIRIYRFANSSIKVSIPEQLGLTLERANTLCETLKMLPRILVR